MQQPPQPGGHAENSSAAGEQAVQALLRDAFRAQPAATPEFRTAVWARIDARKNPTNWAQWLRGHAAGVTAATAVCAMVAATGGGLLAYQQNRSQRQQQIMVYLSSIDAHQHLATRAGSQSQALRQ